MEVKEVLTDKYECKYCMDGRIAIADDEIFFPNHNETVVRVSDYNKNIKIKAVCFICRTPLLFNVMTGQVCH